MAGKNVRRRRARRNESNLVVWSPATKKTKSRATGKKRSPAQRAATAKAQMAAAKKRLAKARAVAESTRKRKAAARARAAKSTKKKLGKKYGPFKSLKATIGGKKKPTYAYRGKSGKAKKIPLWAILGAKSKKDFERRVADDPRLARRVVATKKRRQKAAAKLLMRGDTFTPNKRRKAKKARRVLRSNDMYKKNKKLTKAQRSAAAKKGHRRRKAKARTGLTTVKRKRRVSAKRSAPKRRKRKAAASATPKRRRTAAKRRKSGAKKRRSPAQRRATAKMLSARHGRRIHSKHKRRGKRKAWKNPEVSATPNRRKRRKSGKRRTARRNPMYNANRRRKAARNPMYNANRRRRTRRYRRNPDFMAQLASVFKTGAVIAVGFVVHRGASFLLSEKLLTKVPSLTTGAGATWRGPLAGFLTALVGIPLVGMLAPNQVAKVGSGMVVSFFQQLLLTGLKAAGQPEVAGYFAAYPDAEGHAFHTMSGYGSYELMPPGFAGGMGSYELMPPGFAGLGAITQAAAGYGAITQAAAGMGAITQAAAGMGEFYAQGVQGIGEYEATSGYGSMGAYGVIDEGIPGGDTYSAERALSVAEAAAGLGDLSLLSTVNPDMIAAPIMDAPGGSRAGILAGNNGVFS